VLTDCGLLLWKNDTRTFDGSTLKREIRKFGKIKLNPLNSRQNICSENTKKKLAGKNLLSKKGWSH
jgi:hypothetical protein